MWLMMIAGCFLIPPKLSEDEREAIRAELDLARRISAERAEEWRLAMNDAPSTVVPRPDLGACPIEVFPEPQTDGERQMQQFAAAMSTVGESNVAAVRAAEFATATAPNRAWIESRIERIERQLDPEYRFYDDAPGTRLLQEAKALNDGDDWEWDLIAVVDAQALPGMVNVVTQTFAGGAAVGRAYLYDYRQHVVICAGDFEAHSSEQVDYTQNSVVDLGAGSVAVRRDLDMQVVKAAGRNLVRAGPRP